MAEEVDTMVPETTVVAVQEMSVEQAFEEVIQIASAHNGLRKGLHEYKILIS